HVIKLLQQIQQETGVAYLFISHDLALVRHMCQQVSVMYRGEILETGDSEVVGSAPKHPYTKKLLLAAPIPNPRRQAERRLIRQEAMREWDLAENS
ncbi:MAG: peptide ABC transporter ATP-binding protein, partial [Microbacteriaceae bacterium]